MGRKPSQNPVASITVYPKKSNGLIRIASKHDVFKNERLVLEIDGDYLTIRMAHFDEEEVSLPTCRGHEGWRSIDINSSKLELSKGLYVMEPDAREDTVVIYLGKE